MKNSVVISFVWIAFLSTAITGCKANKAVAEDCKLCTKATVKLLNLDGLDACKWVFELPDGKRLQPTNWPTDKDKPKANKYYTIHYQTLPNAMGTCMVGTMVKVVSVEKGK